MPRLSAALLCAALASPAGALRTEMLVTQGGGTAQKGVGTTHPVEVVSGEALVRFSIGTTAATKTSLLSGLGGEYHRDVAGWSHVSLPAGLGVAAGLSLLKGLPGVLEAQPNHVYRPVAVPNDPLYGSQWALSQINASSAWDFEVGNSSKVTVAVVDSGIDGTHPDLSGKMGSTTDQFCDPGANKLIGGDNTACVNSDGAGSAGACTHATLVAGIAAASSNNGTAMTGVSWGAQLVSLKVFRNADCPTSCNDSGCATDDTAIGDAISFARTVQNSAAYGKMVVNLSLGGATSCAGFLQTIITNAVNDGVVIVAASGNDAGSVNSPANCSGVIPVGATDAGGNIASFSSRGPELASNGVVAPGVSVLSTDAGGGTVSSIDGTSFAAPHVAGVAALILAAKPTFTVAQVLSTLRSSADPVGFGALSAPQYYKTQGNASGAGRLNAFLAVKLAVTGRLADFQGEDKVVAFPNPFRAERHQNVTFAFPPSIQQSTDVSIKIYAQDGALVRELNGLTWNTKNDQGRYVASGTYLFVVSTSKGRRTGRISVLR